MSITAPGADLHEGVLYFLEAVRTRGGDDDLAVVLLREAADLLKERPPRGGGLTEEQASYLIESGDFTAEELARTEREVAAGVLAAEEQETRLGAVSRTLSAAEVAERLHIDTSRVRHRQAKGLLYGLLVGGRRRYPMWQFVPGTTMVLPHLASVTGAFPEGWPASGVEAFMTTPKSGLPGGARQDDDPNPGGLTPVQWLLNDGDPDAVVRILHGFLQS